jgi:hypothetical protein
MDRQFAKGMVIRIGYRDDGGNITHRTIRVNSVFTSRYGHEYVSAYCFTRQEDRTFRADRIISIQPVAGEEPDRSPAPEKTIPVAVPVDKTITHYKADSKTDAVSTPMPAQADTCMADAEQDKKTAGKGTGVRRSIVPAIIAAVLFIVIMRNQNLFTASSAYQPPVDVRNMLFDMEKNKTDADQRAGNTARDSTPAKKTIDKPVVMRDTVTKRETYRGYEIIFLQTQSGLKYRVPDQNITLASYNQAVRSINDALFAKQTGIRNEALNTLYAVADQDNDHRLSWEDVIVFQKKLMSGYKYKSNATALRPDQFIASGGGDCEDWALVTCGLFRYWGCAAYAGCLSNSHSTAAHAVCLAWQESAPGWGEFYHFNSAGYYNGTRIEAGYYIPIDYDTVGDFSNAVGEDWKLTSIDIPESIYGKEM